MLKIAKDRTSKQIESLINEGKYDKAMEIMHRVSKPYGMELPSDFARHYNNFNTYNNEQQRRVVNALYNGYEKSDSNNKLKQVPSVRGFKHTRRASDQRISKITNYSGLMRGIEGDKGNKVVRPLPKYTPKKVESNKDNLKDYKGKTFVLSGGDSYKTFNENGKIKVVYLGNAAKRTIGDSVGSLVPYKSNSSAANPYAQKANQQELKSLPQKLQKEPKKNFLIPKKDGINLDKKENMDNFKKEENVDLPRKSFLNKHWGKMAMGAGAAGALGVLGYYGYKNNNEEHRNDDKEN